MEQSKRLWERNRTGLYALEKGLEEKVLGISAILLIAVSLAMDAFAVSISNGVSVRSFGKRDAIRQAAFFGGFQFIMPVIGWFLGSSVKAYIEAVDHWVAFILLLIIGVNMIWGSLKGAEEENNGYCSLTNKVLLIQAVATSIDALAVGISFAILEVDILQAGVIIGIVSFVISCIGAWAGKYLGEKLQTKAEIIGGIVLILIGAKILIEHTLLGAG
ncbi:manganese efflux pump MntP [Anaerotignum neopropionicum]|nr:manganese efflux pump MntP family protein [Anaerotignum neopropionicum]